MPSLRPVSGSAAEVIDLLADWLAAADEPEPLVVETSGSTGAPKRVRLTRRALLASGEATAAALGVRGQWLLALPITYVAGVQVAVRSLAAGHPPVLLDDHGDLVAAAGALRADVPHLISVVPTQLLRLLDDAASVEALRGFHTVLLGGGPFDPSLRERVAGLGIRMVATYGMAETSGGCVYDGRPLTGVDLRIGDDGRVLLRGPMLFDGYEGDPAATAAALDDGWFRTSDLGRLLPDGRLDLLGRADDVIVSGGLNVPGPAVARRLRAHPDVAEVEVLGVPDAEWGRTVVAFVRGAIDLETARDWVAAELPRAWAPRRVVRLEALPLLANGKVDRVALVEAQTPTHAARPEGAR